MVKYILFMDFLRQDEIDMFYNVSNEFICDTSVSRVLVPVHRQSHPFIGTYQEFYEILGTFELNLSIKGAHAPLPFSPASSVTVALQTACQMHRDYYRGIPKHYHPLSYFRVPEYTYQCAPDIPTVYLSFPPYHVKYKTPTVLASETGRTTKFPELPGRTLGGRFNKAACKLFTR